ncbi:MAG: phage holin family protein [Actinomycetota bacterium]|nr:phage holin family protein [Actinomycetota bacterium]
MRVSPDRLSDEGGDMVGEPGDAPERREVAEILRSLLEELQQLLQKHVELAKQEVLAAIDARIKAVAAGAAAGVLALFGLGFLASAAAYGLARVVQPWAARLIVGGAFLALAAAAALFGRARMAEPPLTPEATKQTLKEDREWAKAQLKR